MRVLILDWLERRLWHQTVFGFINKQAVFQTPFCHYCNAIYSAISPLFYLLFLGSGPYRGVLRTTDAPFVLNLIDLVENEQEGEGIIDFFIRNGAMRYSIWWWFGLKISQNAFLFDVMWSDTDSFVPRMHHIADCVNELSTWNFFHVSWRHVIHPLVHFPHDWNKGQSFSSLPWRGFFNVYAMGYNLAKASRRGLFMTALVIFLSLAGDPMPKTGEPFESGRYCINADLTANEVAQACRCWARRTQRPVRFSEYLRGWRLCPWSDANRLNGLTDEMPTTVPQTVVPLVPTVAKSNPSSATVAIHG